MAVKAKFFVERIITYVNAPGQEVSQKEVCLRAVYGDSEENKSWSKWTPAGEAKLSITNPEAFKQFKEGQVVFLTLEPQE